MSGNSNQDALRLDWNFAGVEAKSVFAAESHHLSAQLGSSLEEGLSESTAESRLKRDGLNKLKPIDKSHILKRFLTSFFGDFQLLLWLTVVLASVANELSNTPDKNYYTLCLARSLLVVCTLSGSIQFLQEAEAIVILIKRKFATKKSVVIRGGVRKTIPTIKLVVGDIVELGASEKVPTDMRVVRTDGLTVNKSWLTGESRLYKVTADPVPETTNYIEANNMLFAGSTVVDGTCRGLVITTGKHNQVTKIVGLTESQCKIPALQRDFRTLVKMLAGVLLVFTVLLVAHWAVYLRRWFPDYLPVNVMLLKTVGLCVAVVPLGLPIAIRAGLVVGARQLLSQSGVLVKTLDTAVTLGTATMLIVDKTGTITKNSMAVTGAVSASGFRDPDQLTGDLGASKLAQPVLDATYRLAALCNEAELDTECALNKRNRYGTIETVEEQEFGSNSTDRCILAWAHDKNDILQLRRSHDVQARIPFSSDVRRAMVLVRTSETQETFVFVKGAPETILTHCTQYLNDEGESEELSEDERDHIAKIIGEKGGLGCRMVVMAQMGPLSEQQTQEMMDSPAFPETGLTFVSCLAMYDPPREGSREAVQKMRGAGIRVVMVTGDSVVTAIFSARNAGIISGHDKPVHRVEDMHRHLGKQPSFRESDAILVKGDKIAQLSENEWEYVFSHEEVVFARTTAGQRILLVERGQRMGHLVAVTGDGVNDTPALKRAPVGVVMNYAPRVARDVGDIVLLTDNFPAVVDAIARGRLLFVNMRCALAYFLAGCCGKVLAVVAQFLLGLPTPLTVLCMVVISCLHDMLGGLALMLETPGRGLMTAVPRDAVQEPLLDWKIVVYSVLFYGIMVGAGCFCNYFDFMHSQGYNIQGLVFAFNWTLTGQVNQTDQSHATSDEATLRGASTVFYVTVVLGQIGHLLSVRRKTPYFYDTVTGGRGDDTNGDLAALPTVPWTTFLISALSIVCSLLLVHIPVMTECCYMAPVSARYWGLAVAWSALWFAVAETRKWIIALYPQSWLARMDW